MERKFVTTKNSQFYFDEKPFRFIGCNMYELANVDSAITQAMIKDAFDAGFKVIRFWAFEPVKKEKLNEICDVSGDYNLKIIPVLSDMTGYLQNYKIEKGWFTEGYKNSYLKYVLDITGNFKDRNEILLWELINEPVTDSFDEIYNFAKDVSEKIKATDSNHLVSLGTIGGIGDKFGNFFSRFKPSNFENLYSIKSLDTVSLHDYSFNSTLFERLDIMYRLKGFKKNSGLTSALSNIINYLPNEFDRWTINNFSKTFDFPLTIRSVWRHFNRINLQSAKKLNKPVYIGEAGYKKNMGELRKKIIQIELKKYFNEGIGGVLLWSFESQGKSIDGHDYGFEDNYVSKDVLEKHLS